MTSRRLQVHCPSAVSQGTPFTVQVDVPAAAADSQQQDAPAAAATLRIVDESGADLVASGAVEAVGIDDVEVVDDAAVFDGVVITAHELSASDRSGSSGVMKSASPTHVYFQIEIRSLGGDGDEEEGTLQAAVRSEAVAVSWAAQETTTSSGGGGGGTAGDHQAVAAGGDLGVGLLLSRATHAMAAGDTLQARHNLQLLRSRLWASNHHDTALADAAMPEALLDACATVARLTTGSPMKTRAARGGVVSPDAAESVATPTTTTASGASSRPTSASAATAHGSQLLSAAAAADVILDALAVLVAVFDNPSGRAVLVCAGCRSPADPQHHRFMLAAGHDGPVFHQACLLCRLCRQPVDSEAPPPALHVARRRSDLLHELHVSGLGSSFESTPAFLRDPTTGEALHVACGVAQLAAALGTAAGSNHANAAAATGGGAGDGDGAAAAANNRSVTPPSPALPRPEVVLLRLVNTRPSMTKGQLLHRMGTVPVAAAAASAIEAMTQARLGGDGSDVRERVDKLRRRAETYQLTGLQEALSQL